jgi:hypothetical protein
MIIATANSGTSSIVSNPSDTLMGVLLPGPFYKRATAQIQGKRRIPVVEVVLFGVLVIITGREWAMRLPCFL